MRDKVMNQDKTRREELNQVTEQIIGSAFTVSNELLEFGQTQQSEPISARRKAPKVSEKWLQVTLAAGFLPL
jgi:hypothetical protein